MNKPERILENRSEQAYRQQTLQSQQPQNTTYPSFCSPFRKHLPVIYETQTSPHQSFGPERADYLRSQYESRLIAVDEELFGSRVEGSMPNDSRLLNQKEKQLLNKIYEKEKELVMLENKFHLLKNSNQCLRDTIKEDQVEKQQLNQQVYRLNQQSVQLKQQSLQQKQNIEQLTKKISEMQEKIHKNQTQQREEYKFFKEYDLQSRSIHELSNQNIILKKEIQELKVFYEQEFYRMLQNHQQTVKYLEQRIKNIQKQNSQLQIKVEEISEKLLIVNNEKKEMLEYYLRVIEEMKREISPMKTNAITVSQHILQQDSILEPKSEYPDINTSVLNQNIDLSINDMNNDKLLDIGKYVGRMIRNGQQNDKSRSRSKHNKNSRPKSVHKSGSMSSLNVLNMNFNMESNSRLNTTLMSYKYTDRVIPTKRYHKISPMKKPLLPITHHSMMSIKVPSSSFLSKQLETPRLKNTYNKKYQDIDRKLQYLKEKLTREITY